MTRRLRILQRGYDVFEHCVWPPLCDIEHYKSLPDPLNMEEGPGIYRLGIIDPIKLNYVYYDKVPLTHIQCHYETFELIQYWYKSRFCDNVSVGYGWRQVR